jgi:hypothetical protein
MAVSSLPHYQDRPKRPTLQSNEAELISCRRITSFWIRIVWVAGIWGALFAFRSVLLSQESQASKDPRDAIIGTWEATEDSSRSVVFEYGQFLVKKGDKVLVSGNYAFKNDGTISTTRKTWDHKTGEEVELHYAEFKAKVRGDDLILLDARDGTPWYVKRKR